MSYIVKSYSFGQNPLHTEEIDPDVMIIQEKCDDGNQYMLKKSVCWNILEYKQTLDFSVNEILPNFSWHPSERQNWEHLDSITQFQYDSKDFTCAKHKFMDG